MGTFEITEMLVCTLIFLSVFVVVTICLRLLEGDRSNKRNYKYTSSGIEQDRSIKEMQEMFDKCIKMLKKK